MDEANIELHYDIPIWAQREAPEGSTVPRVPQQAMPVHETAPPLVVPTPVAAPEQEFATFGEWREHLPRRRVRGAVLILALAGAVDGLVRTVTTHSSVAIGATIVCTVVAIVNRTALITVTPTAVKLDGSTLTVRRNGRTDVFALSDPTRRIETVGLPGQPGWRLVLEAPDLRIVELSEHQVDPAILHPIVRAQRELAAIKRREHEERLRR